MDPLYYNGELIRAEEWDVGPNRLYSENYVYQHLHTFAHKPLHIATHIEILKEATRTVFGEAITLDAQELNAAVETLLKAGRYPLESNQVTVYVYPQGLRDEGEAVWMLEATAQLFYPRYQLRNTRPLLETFPVSARMERISDGRLKSRIGVRPRRGTTLRSRNCRIGTTRRHPDPHR